MRRLLPIALVVAGALVALVAVTLATRPSPTAAVAIGGPFQLVDANNRPVTDETLLGKPSAMFFGFTYCPEICPTTLAEMSAALKTLGPDAEKLNVVFVSVDPERDTPEQMKGYLASFDPHIQGFTGSVEAVNATAKAYRVYHRKVPIDGGGYTVDHSSAVYLFDRKGRFVEPIGYGSPQDRVVAQLRSLLRGRS